MTHFFESLACPLDGEPLQREAAAWRCPSGHSFDVAAQGYVNLLPVQYKRSRDPGDSKAMVAARRRFLNSGAYAPIAAAVAAVLAEHLPHGPLACLDAGCGEGYYMRRLALHLAGRPLAQIGLDISKWAVQAAAKQDPNVTWVVGSNARLPVLDASLDCVLCLFGFPVYAEFARVLKPGGVLIQVDAGPAHLRELREVIYPELKPERASAAVTPPGFATLSSHTKGFDFELVGPAVIADLLAMTPHHHLAGVAGRERAAALQSLRLTADLRVACHARASGDVLVKG